MAQSDYKKTLLAQIGVIAGFVGSLSVLAIFIALFSAWVFGRGVMSALGFPTAIIGFKSSLDLFPSLATLSTMFLMLFLSLGFYPLKSKSKLASNFAFGAIVILCVFIALRIENQLIKFILAPLALISPCSLGYIIQNTTELRFKVIKGLLITFLLFVIHTDSLYILGKQRGFEILTLSSNPQNVAGAAMFRLDDYPLVSIISTEKLLFETPPIQFDKGYLYEAQGDNFIRLVFKDEGTYYFVESYSGNHTSIATSKSVITQIHFTRSR